MMHQNESLHSAPLLHKEYPDNAIRLAYGLNMGIFGSYFAMFSLHCPNTLDITVAYHK